MDTVHNWSLWRHMEEFAENQEQQQNFNQMGMMMQNNESDESNANEWESKTNEAK